MSYAPIILGFGLVLGLLVYAVFSDGDDDYDD